MSNSQTFANVKAGLDTALKLFAEESVARIKRRTPSVTGTLRDGWQSSVTSDSITISNDVPYAGFVEYGTNKVAPRAMVRTTAEEAQSIWSQSVEKAGLK